MRFVLLTLVGEFLSHYRTFYHWIFTSIAGYPVYYLSIAWLLLIVLVGALGSIPLIVFGKPNFHILIPIISVHTMQ